MASIDLPLSATVKPRYLRMSRAYTRAAIYAFLASLVLAAVAVWVNRMVQAPLKQCWGVLMFPIVGMVPLLFVLRWRLRIDLRGVAVQRLIGWREWTWEDMLEGRVKLKSVLRFQHDRSLGRQLSLECLGPADAHYVSRLCRLACVHRPPPETVAQEIVFCDEWNRRVRCTIEGMQLPTRSRMVVPWSDIVAARIVRAAREINEFQRIELQLCDRALRVTAVQQWSVRELNDEATIAAFLIARIPRGRLSIVSLGDPPATLQEANELLAENQTKLSRSQNVLRWWPICCVGLIAICCLSELWHMISFIAFLGVKYQLIFWLLGGPFRHRHRLLESARDDLLSGHMPDASNPGWTMIRA